MENLLVDDLEVSPSTKKALKAKGFVTTDQLEGASFPELYEVLSFGQAKLLLKVLIQHGVTVTFRRPNWNEAQWHEFVESLVTQGIVTWQEIAMAVCGELNPPQVGTAIASNKSFQKKFPPKQTMRNVMAWFYSQDGRCRSCGTRLFLEADHIESKQDFRDTGRNLEDADTLANLQLLCKRCNVIKRPSHGFGGISFAPAQSVLIWILLTEMPRTKAAFFGICRSYGLTMATIRFDEAWAFAEWLRREGKYPQSE